MPIDKSKTHPLIKQRLGATYTISELEEKLKTMKRLSATQAPYFEGRLLDRIERIENTLTAIEKEA